MGFSGTFAGIFGGGDTPARPKQRNRTVDRSVVRDFEIEDFTGLWYEIARTVNGREERLSHVTETFTVDADGMVFLRREGVRSRQGSMETTRSRVLIPDAGRQASMKVSGLPFSDREFNILEIDEDYNLALAGGRSANRLWILSRTPQIPQDDLRYLIARALERGYDISSLTFTDSAAVVQPEEAYAYAM